MIRKLRIKFILIIMMILLVVFAGVLLAINIITQNVSYNQNVEKLTRLAANDIGRGAHGDEGFLGENTANTFSVKLDLEGNIRSIYLGQSEQLYDEEFLEEISYYVESALAQNERIGMVDSYMFLVESKIYGTLIVFLDNTQHEEQTEILFRATLVIGICTLAVLAIISSVLAFVATKPVKQAFDKQKAFISDASHELKTPLAVINTNIDVLESEIGVNKWLEYIKDESVRMNELVQELLCLARMDDSSSKAVFSNINLSNVVLLTVLPFESTVFESGKTLETEVDDDIMLHADESKIKHLVSILLDNAIKYSDDKGIIKVSLHMHNNKPTLEVYNTGKGIEKKDYKKIFERFYREDQARNSAKGGYGLGLAIAHSIVEEHGGKISVQSSYGHWITFTVTF